MEVYLATVLCFGNGALQERDARLAVSREQLEALQDCGFRWSDIGRMLCVSSSTLCHRRHQLGMPVEGREFSPKTDTIRQALQVTPAAGLKIQGYLRQRGLTVQGTHILHSLTSAQRIIRPVYNVPSPNALW